MDFDALTTREVPLDPKRSALLFIDVQNFSVRRDGGEFRDVSDCRNLRQIRYYFRSPPLGRHPQHAEAQAGLSAGRASRCFIRRSRRSPKDGRDRSLDYKITGFLVPKGSPDGRVIDEIAPNDDEIVLPKGSSSVFIIHHIDLPAALPLVAGSCDLGLLTDQCREIRCLGIACDLGYLVTLVTDACATYSADRARPAPHRIKGICRQVDDRRT
jgi:nicotinamidase-related amidase